MSRRHLWPLLLLAVVTAAVYGQCLDHQFLNWDDQDYITRNWVVQELTLGHLRAAFSNYFVGNYAPLQILSYMLDHALWGLRPAGFLLTNLLCHFVAAMLFYYLVLRIDGREAVALIAALFFLVHPVQVESVAWISQRKNLLAMVFFLVAWHGYLGFRESGAGAGRRWRYAGSLLTFLLACLAKSVAVILPLVLVLYDLLIRRDRLRDALRLDKLGYLVIAVATAWLAMLSQDPAQGGGRTVYHGGSALGTLFTMLPVLVRYLVMLVWPVDLSAVYSPPIRTSPDLVFVLSLLLLLAVAAVAIVLYRRRSPLAFWIALFFVGLLPVSQIVPLVTLMNDRYLYFPMLGATTAAALLFAALHDRMARVAAKKSVICLAGFLVVALGSAAFVRARVWHDSIALWSDAYRKNPPIPQTAHSLGRAYRDVGDLQQALPYYRQALTFVPNDALVLFNLTDLYLRLDQREEAAGLIQRMRTSLPANDLRLLLIEGQYFMTVGDLPRAENILLQALKVEPGHPDGLYRLGQVYARMDRLGSAQAAFLLTLQNGNQDPEVYYELACVETARGAAAQALQYLHKAVQRGYAPQRLRNDARLHLLRTIPEFQQILAGG